jgi:hypothetical protein
MKDYKRFIVTSFFFVFLICSAAFAAPTTSTQAGNVVRGWLKHNSSPFGELAGEFLKVEAYGENGKASNPSEALYYAVYLDPSGIVLIPADDELDPITAYAADATWYGPEPANPLYDSIGAGIAEMVKKHNSEARRSSGTSEAREKWASLEKLAKENGNREALGPLLGGPQPVIVAPFLKTKWDQAQVLSGNIYVYNRFTPLRFPAGCGAVMMAQIMKYFEWPTVPISDLVKGRVYKITINGDDPQPWDLRGGDDKGGAYEWGNMPDAATDDTTEEQAYSIGRLMADAAVVIGSDFGAEATSSYPDKIAGELVSSFGYGNAILAKSSGVTTASQPGQLDSGMMLRAINSNLDAKKPVGLGIYRRSDYAGHGVVADGYGYSYGSIYHHINLGWGEGVNDPGRGLLWYNLPLVLDYDLVDSVIYNIYDVKPITGTEIISGRVVTSDDKAAAGALVTIIGPNIRNNLVTDDGRFVFTGIPSNKTFTILAALDGHSFPVTEVTTGESYSPTAYNNYTSSVGNVWDLVIQEDKPEGKGCGVASFPAVFVIVGAGAIFLRKKRLKPYGPKR